MAARSISTVACGYGRGPGGLEWATLRAGDPVEGTSPRRPVTLELLDLAAVHGIRLPNSPALVS
jgi:hypothetical protein